MPKQRPCGASKRHSAIGFFLLFLAILRIVFSMENGQGGEQLVVDKAITFTPAVLPASSPEIANPWRGAYEWYDSGVIPAWPVVDSYVRYDWKEIEPTQGNYDFSLLDKELALAQVRHGKFGFRIMPAGVDNVAVPEYLTTLMPHGGWFTNTYAGKQAYEPDWNDPHYMARAQALMNALGQRYNNDPRLGWVDMFPYGNWGEWHLFGFPETVAPMNATNQRILIDTMIHAFSNKFITMFTTDSDSLSYALSSSPKVGIRVDCLGTVDMGNAVEKLSLIPLAQDRWKTAPFIFEFCKQADFQIAWNQVKMYHGAMVSNGNVSSYKSYSFIQQYYLQKTFSTSGYRFVLRNMTLPSRIPKNTRFTVTTQWSNVNVTPAYSPWNAMLQLRNSSGSVVWQSTSRLDLQTLLPTTDQLTGIDKPISVTDHFQLPATIPTGNYSVSTQIFDPDNYYEPLHLAIQGRQIDGSFLLGTVTVVA